MRRNWNENCLLWESPWCLKQKAARFFLFDQRDYLDKPQRNLCGLISRLKTTEHPIFSHKIQLRDAEISVQAEQRLTVCYQCGQLTFQKKEKKRRKKWKPFISWQKSGMDALLVFCKAERLQSQEPANILLLIIYAHEIRYGLGFGDDCWLYFFLLFFNFFSSIKVWSYHYCISFSCTPHPPKKYPIQSCCLYNRDIYSV